MNNFSVQFQYNLQQLDDKNTHICWLELPLLKLHQTVLNCFIRKCITANRENCYLDLWS